MAVTGCRQGDLADAALASPTRFIELDAAAWTNNTVRLMARNISPSATFRSTGGSAKRLSADFASVPKVRKTSRSALRTI